MPDDLGEERWREYRITPRYLAGSGGVGDPAFAPVDHWPRLDPDDDSFCQLLITSPDGRIRLGWFGDDYEPVKITASEDAVGPVRWSARFNHNFPPEITAGFTNALAQDGKRDAECFFTRPSISWAENVEPLLEAGWEQLRASQPGTVELRAPDRQAGAILDARERGRQEETVLLWAGPEGYLTRAEATFTADAPAHLIAATTAAMTDPAPVVRERHMIHRDIEHLVQFDPVPTSAPSPSRAPTPLEVRQAAVTAAVHRAQAARIRTTQPNTPTSPTPPSQLPRQTPTPPPRPRR